MSKSKVRKILNAVFGGVIALCMLICINTPDLFKAEIIGFGAPVFRSYYYNQGQKFLGNEVAVSTPSTWNFYSYPGRMDNSNVNMGFEFNIGMSGPSLPEYANLYGKSYNIRFSFGCRNYNQGKTFGFNTEEIQNVSCIVTYADGRIQNILFDYTLLEVTGSASGNYTVSLDLSGFYDGIVSSIVFGLYFNFHYAFGVPVDYASQNAMDMTVSSTSWANTTSKPPELPSINELPDFKLPDVDTDGLPIIDEYLPDSDNVLVDSLSRFFNMAPVFISLSIVSVVGLVSYVLFGKR